MPTDRLSCSPVVVREGSVALGPEHQTGGPPATLQSGDLGRLGERADRIQTRRVNADDYLGWVEDRLVFRNTPFPEVARRLERWYNVEVRLEDESLADRHLTATFHDASPRSVAEVIATTLRIQHQMEERTITFGPRPGEQ